jgi:DNA-binding transcriptional LysR family regulator
MNFDQLTVFKAIADLGTLRAAGKQLGRTQPAISASLKQLETQLGFEVFSRKTYRPSLTPKGKRMLACTRELLTAVQSWQEIADDLGKGCEPELCIAIDSATPLELVVPKINSALENYPSVRLDLHFGVVTQSIEELLNGTAQLAIAPLFTTHNDLEFLPLFGRVLTPCIHKRLIKDANCIQIKELRKVANIIATSGSDTSPIGVPGLGSGKKLYVSNHAVKEQMITLGLGWGRIPEDLLNHFSDLVPIKIPEVPKVKIEISVAWRRDTPLGPAARRVRDSLSDFRI